jgi:hypothetical protein
MPRGQTQYLSNKAFSVRNALSAKTKAVSNSENDAPGAFADRLGLDEGRPDSYLKGIGARLLLNQSQSERVGLLAQLHMIVTS